MMRKLQRRRVRFRGLTVGLDLHQKVTQYSVLSQAGDELANDRVGSSAEQFSRLLDRWAGEGQAVQVVLEASGCFLWAFDWLVDRLGRERVHVAAPSRVRVIAESQEKTDANDAWWLAYLCWEGRLPEAFVAEGDLRELRIATRGLRTLIDQRSDLMREMRSHLRQLGHTFGAGDWHSQVGHERIKALLGRVTPQAGVRGQLIEELWERIQAMDERVARWRGRCETLAKSFDQIATLERELPGLGIATASVVIAELGDPSRYRRAKSYAKATGLTPGYRESGGRRLKLKMTREGSAHMRWALTRAVVACMRCKSGPGLAVKQWVQRQQRRKAKKAAIVAAARKLAEAVWRLFALGEAFDLTRSFGRPRLAAT